MKTYTEKEVLQIINFVCTQQKSEAHKVISYIIEDDSITQQQADEAMLNYLSNDVIVEINLDDLLK